jgi:2-polyprenyl-6-methoxyphenol hydroxylase-like FAD-dependent oxidoreductase
MGEPRIVVAGAGIGGLCFAIAARNAGLDAHVYEKDTELRPVGAGLTLFTNATRALQLLGVAEAMRERGATMEICEFRTAKGGLLASWPTGELGREHGAPTLMISREHVHEALLAELGAERVHLSSRVTGFEDQGERVEIEIEGAGTQTCDALVGADGLSSTVRARLHGEEPPRFAGYTVMRAVVQDAGSLVPADSFCSLWGRGERFVYYDIGLGQTYWMSVANNDTPGAAQEQAVKEMLAERHRGWAEPIERLIDATSADAIHATDICDRPPLAHWGRGRVTLLGDAAHPMTFNSGQGAGSGMEDAVVLAACLKGTEDVVAALREYEARRRPRTDHRQNTAWRIGNLGRMSNPLACMARDTMMRVIYRTVALKEHAKDMDFAP